MRGGEGDELPQNDVGSDAERCERVHGGDAPDDRAGVVHEPLEHVVHGAGERQVGGVQRVDPAPRGRRVVHAHVVHVGEQHSEPDHELAPVVRPAR